MDGAKFGLGFDCSDAFVWGGKAEIRGTFNWEKPELFKMGIVIDDYKTFLTSSAVKDAEWHWNAAGSRRPSQATQAEWAERTGSSPSPGLQTDEQKS